jgi:hypothetical protein
MHNQVGLVDSRPQQKVQSCAELTEKEEREFEF